MERPDFFELNKANTVFKRKKMIESSENQINQPSHWNVPKTEDCLLWLTSTYKQTSVERRVEKRLRTH